MKKYLIVFLVICSLGLTACQNQSYVDVDNINELGEQVPDESLESKVSIDKLRYEKKSNLGDYYNSILEETLSEDSIALSTRNNELTTLVEKQFLSGGKVNKFEFSSKDAGDFDVADNEYYISFNGVSKFISQTDMLDGVYLVDLDKDDEYKEIAISEATGSETYIISFYRFEDNEIVDYGSFEVWDSIDGIREYDGKFVSSNNAISFENEDFYPYYKCFENNELVYKFIKYEDVKNKEYVVSEETLEILNGERLEENPLKVGEKLRILGFDENDERIVHTETDGFFDMRTWGMIIRVVRENGEINIIGQCRNIQYT